MFLTLGSSDLGQEINHPILITECACNPVASRSKMAELLFETYGVPSVAFGIDAAFSYKYNQHLGICNDDGLALCAGLTTSHVIPFIEGEPVLGACCRANIGGYNVTDYLKQLLSLKYPLHANSITQEKAEDLKREHCYVAADYFSELKLFQQETSEAEEKTRFWQLPFVPPPQEEPPTEEELARKAAQKERQAQRLREMAAAKRSSKIADLEGTIGSLEELLGLLDSAEDDEAVALLLDRGYTSREEVESAASKAVQSLRKLKGEPLDPDEKPEAHQEDKYTLVNVPDHMLTPEQLKEKKKQVFLKTTYEGRMRAKQRKFEEELEKERRNQLEEERRLENPEVYLEELRSRYRELTEKMERRKRPKSNGNGSMGRSERLNAAQRERMRLLTTAVLDRGKGEDTFGTREEDWQLYKLMSRDNDDDEDDDGDDAELGRIVAKLQEMDPGFATAAREVVVTADDYRVRLGVERFRCPEVLFRPEMVGVDQAGLGETVRVALRRVGAGRGTGLCKSILLTGGGCAVPGLARRVEGEVRMIQPVGSPVRAVLAADPILDAWRGAALCAAGPRFSGQVFTREEYLDRGDDGLRGYRLRYS
ncbi:actin-related protein 5 isoform X2 [Wolffia australiana]